MGRTTHKFNSMIVIADSGSTKTQWALLHNNGEQERQSTVGLNPHFTDDATFLSVLKTLHGVGEGQCFFYGAGCGATAAQQRVARLITTAFPQMEVQVAGDLIGACRATCGNKAGLVGILGTGSNACRYNGTQIVAQVPSVGYILGDEGSGNHIGRRLLKDYLYGTMPQKISQQFHDRYPQSKEEIIEHLYHQPYANRYLASFAPFASEHRKEDYIATLLNEVFNAYFQQQLQPLYPTNETLHLVGSVAVAFQEHLIPIAAHHGINTSVFTHAPIDGLVGYHQVCR